MKKKKNYLKTKNATQFRATTGTTVVILVCTFVLITLVNNSIYNLFRSN